MKKRYVISCGCPVCGVLNELKDTRKRLQTLKEHIDEYFELGPMDLRQKRGEDNLVMARQVYCYVAIKHLGLKTKQVASFINKEPQTVRHAVMKIEGYIELDRPVRQNINRFLKTRLDRKLPQKVEDIIDEEFTEYQSLYRNASFKKLQDNLRSKLTELYLEELANLKSDEKTQTFGDQRLSA